MVVLVLMTGAAVRAAVLIEIDGTPWVATELARENFADAGWRERWVVEGGADVKARDGRLTIVAQKQPARNDVCTVWWRLALPRNVMIELEAGSEFSAEDNAANLNLFFHARELDGGPYGFGRSGNYADYHQVPNYIITLTGGFQPGWSRVRRNPGFVMIGEEPSTRSEVGKGYRIRVIIAGGRIRYWLNDRLVHDVHDPDPLPGGHFALRTWRSRVWWSDVRFSSLQPAATRTIEKGSRPQAPEPVRPWLMSGFEEGVEVVRDVPTSQGVRDFLAGRDATTGFDWSSDLPAGRGNFFYHVHPGLDSHEFVRTEIRPTIGRHSQPTRALYMESRQLAVMRTGSISRNEYSLFQPGYRQAYTRYWMRLQDNVADIAPRDEKQSWRMFFEIKEPDSGVERVVLPNNRGTGTNNYRISFYIRRKTDGQFYWHVRGEAPQPLRVVDWDLFNDEVPVPIDRWFQVEVFFRTAEAPHGLVWLAVDGQQVVLHRGNTQHPDNPLPVSFWSPLKLYMGSGWFEAGPASQWIDDIELWPDFPPDATRRDDSRANQSTFESWIKGDPNPSSPGPGTQH